MQTGKEASSDLFERIPAVSTLLASGPLADLARTFGQSLTTELVREDLAILRDEARTGRIDPDELERRARPDALAHRVESRARSLLAPSPRSVVNATGVVVHTNLGRSILSVDAARRVAETASSYMDLELDLARGQRGSRMSHLRPLLERLFPGQDSLVVNNNAGAILLALRGLARGKEVVLSRGELVEIGGSFRIPDILALSGARLREVGTTNRTRIADYQAAIGPKTGAILKVHTSNFRIVGFTEEVTVPVLSELARGAGIPLVVDWGSGDLVDLGPLGIHDELPVRRILEDGADVVSFSGDKLLGGPQAGFLVGQTERIARLARDPLARVLRVDRILLAAIRETLASYVRDRAFQEVPTLRMLALSAEEVGRRATALLESVAARLPVGIRLAILDGVSRTGGGSSPLGERPTRLLAVSMDAADAGRLERALRRGDPPVIARVAQARLLLDLRTVLPEQDAALGRRLVEATAAAVKPFKPFKPFKR